MKKHPLIPAILSSWVTWVAILLLLTGWSWGYYIAVGLMIFVPCGIKRVNFGALWIMRETFILSMMIARYTL